MRSLKRTDDQIAVIAGDLSSSKYIAVGLKLFCEKFPHVVYVTGNHEYYGSSFVDVHERIADMMGKLPNLHWLSNSYCEIDGKRIHGSTLWFPEAGHLGVHKFMLNDFRMIERFEPEVYQWHDHSRKYLKDAVEKGDIVVTHHAPSFKSIHPRYERNLLNCFFASHSESVVRDTEPSLWIHGHTHSSFDYMIGTTRVICNPFGYASYEENPEFNDELVV